MYQRSQRLSQCDSVFTNILMDNNNEYKASNFEYEYNQDEM